MAGADAGHCEELAGLNKRVAEQNERIRQLEGDLKARDNLIQSLEQKMRRLENVASVDTEPAGPDLNSNSDLESDLESVLSDENADKLMRGESCHDNQNPNPNPPDFVEAAMRAARIPMILSKLLSKMRTRDLLENARLVSREWLKSATDILRKRHVFKIMFKFKPQSSFRASPRGFFTLLHNSRPLKEFTTFLIHAKTFPCAHFGFDGNVRSVAAQAFLSEFGQHVKGLQLIGAQDLNCLRKCLLQLIPNLESLELSKFVDQEVQNPASSLFPQASPLSPAFKIPSLTLLKLGEGNSQGLVREILSAAPNLQEVSGISSPEEIEMLRPRIHIVKGLNLKLGSGGWSQEALVNFYSILKSRILQQNQNQLHLTFLKVNCDAKDVSDFGSLLPEILESSRNSLRELKMSPCLYFDSLFHWPQLEKVDKLTLAGELPMTRRFASTCARRISQLEIQQVLPNLHTISFEGFSKMTPEHTNSLKLHLQIPGLKSLVIFAADRVTELLLPILLNTGITVLALDPVLDFEVSAPVIWQMRGLKSLRLRIFYVSVLELDVGFTGLKKQACKLLRSSERTKFQAEEIEKWRVNPSVLNLTDLERLDLHCRINTEPRIYTTEIYEDGLTPEFISFQYAFKLMPKLAVVYHHES